MGTGEETPGLGSIENPVRFKDQDFKKLLEACVKSGELFDDPAFPAEQKSIGMPEDPDPKNAIKWLRPKEIGKNAVFVEGTTGTTDICQGQLGNCWLLAALSCLTMHPTLFVKVVPPGQSLSQSYAGIFYFRFWQYGEWVEVVVDDRLPVRGGRLLFSYSHTCNEYWSALVEKAYAKLIGCYGSLKGGNISEGMEDFTGGIAYSTRVLNASVETLLLRLRNPWGFVEYRGPWSDKAKEWDDVDEAEKEKIELIKKEDGEFCFSHICTDSRSPVWAFWPLLSLLGSALRISPGSLTVVELCSVNPDTLTEENPPASPVPPPSSTWTISEHEGFWVPGSSAGGSRKYKRSFWKNPQFQLVLREGDQPDDGDQEDEEDEEDEEVDGDDSDEETAKEERAEKRKQKSKRCTVLVELLQKNRRQRDKVHFLYIAFHVYKVMAAPVSPDDQMRVQKTFDEAAGPDDRVNAKELMELFNSALDKDYHLPLETCRQLIFGEDTKGRASLSRKQAETLLTTLRQLQAIFFQFDEDSSGTMSPFELSAALEAVALYESETSREVKDRGINFRLCSSILLLHPPSPQPLPSCPVGRDDALTARRLFLEVLVFQWHRGGGWSKNSSGVVVFSVGVGDLGRAGLVGDQ
ncbi:hypothetical protein fugu_011162 [Takifugu bimaculatus]|uniref:Calpain catalytic domain-containing protein n=1 Tax=Takifugu bimaculatus TaxID=433685 RepID=A0A4Z2CC96_9TELE|nr:hypothetical protein fugu_011162 [Takifugu bimaculatus]